MKLLLRSIAGSHLYGLATETSDMDYYDVVDSFNDLPEQPHHMKGIQTISGGIDVTMMTLSQFMVRAQEGSHQALDAMFSQNVLTDHITALRHNFRVGNEIVETYNRTISKFIHQDNPRKFKHAMRLGYNLAEAIQKGRFNPTLSPEKAEHVLRVSKLPKSDVINEVLKLTPYINLDGYRL